MKQPYDKNCRQSQQSRSGSNNSSRRPSPASRPQSQTRPETSMTKTIEDSQRRINIKTRSNRHRIHLQHRQQQQGEQMNGPPLPSKGQIIMEAGKKPINLNIGDQSQFYQCAATRYCQKQHIWPINMTTPKFCPEYVANQKN